MLTTESLLHFFWPMYVLDIRVQSAGGPGSPKWEPRCCTGVYLGHSPFHAGSVSLLFNLTTGLESPQFHVVFDNSFSTVPYMNAGTTPPNSADLVMHSSELYTYEAFEFAENWISNLPPLVPESDCVPDPALNRITNPFVVVPDATSAYETKTNAPLTQAPVMTGTERGGIKSANPLLVSTPPMVLQSLWVQHGSDNKWIPPRSTQLILRA